MVESATAKSSAMARLLSCEHRWAVSGVYIYAYVYETEIDRWIDIEIDI